MLGQFTVSKLNKNTIFIDFLNIYTDTHPVGAYAGCQKKDKCPALFLALIFKCWANLQH
jgi:hypothetical protein